MKTALGGAAVVGSAAAATEEDGVPGREAGADGGLLTAAGILRMVASFIGVQSRLVGGGVGLAGGLEKVAKPIGFEDRFKRREPREDLGPIEALKAEADGEPLRDVEDCSLAAAADEDDVEDEVP